METSVSFYSDPIFGPNYHVTSRLNSPSKNVLSNYNILQSYKSQQSHVRKINDTQLKQKIQLNIWLLNLPLKTNLKIDK